MGFYSVRLGGPFDSFELYRQNIPQPWWSKLPRIVLGERVLGFAADKCTLKDLAPLLRLKSLQGLSILESKDFDDITQIAEFRKLELLMLPPQIHDFGQLPRLRKMKYLRIKASREDIETLQESLPNCEITRYLIK
jgi:hypothetical protein